MRKLLTQLVYLLQTSNALRSKQVQFQLKQQASVISNMRRKIMQLESNVGMYVSLTIIGNTVLSLIEVQGALARSDLIT